jgi:hypothetical protein
MSTLDVPTSGRVSFHRLSVRLLRDVLLAAEARNPSQSFGLAEGSQAVATYLRPVAYLAQPLGT